MDNRFSHDLAKFADPSRPIGRVVEWPGFHMGHTQRA